MVRFTVDLGAGPIVAELTPRAVVDFERLTGRSVLDIVDGRSGMSDFYWLAWDACRRAGQVEVEFDAFVDTLVGFEASDIPKD